MKQVDLKAIILEFVHSETGWGTPLRPQCEFEDLYLDDPEKLSNDKTRVTFRYYFDEDGFSQYDKGHKLEGMIVVDATGKIVESTLEETHRGPAALLDRYKLNS